MYKIIYQSILINISPAVANLYTKGACALNLCANHGQCILDGNLGFKCECINGWEGALCTKRSDPCNKKSSKYICDRKNTEKCIKSLEGPMCICKSAEPPDGYAGLTDPDGNPFKWVYASSDCSGTEVVQDVCNSEFLVYQHPDPKYRLAIHREQAYLPATGSFDKFQCKSKEIRFSGLDCFMSGRIHNKITKQCDYCPRGQIGRSDKCYDCRQGHVCPVNTGLEQKCPAGTFATRGADKCTQCPAGEFSNEGSEKCERCNPGSELGRHGSCVICQAGKVSPDGLKCVFCPAGEVSDRGGTSCSFCNEGYFCPENSSDEIKCPVNQYCEEKVSEPIPCPNGQTSNENSASCMSCNQECGKLIN